MKAILTFWLIGLVMTITGINSVANAGMQSVVGGSNAPASALGPYSTTSFGDDLRPVDKQYNYVDSPFNGEIHFDSLMEHHEVSSGWITWSHDYSGDIYWETDGDFLVSLAMPEGTSAFYFYAQPRFLEVNTITAVAYDGLSSIEKIDQDVNGDGGACYFGFYGTKGSTIKTINVYSDQAFAIGEFGISMIPVPETLCLSNVGLCALMELKRRRMI